MLSSSQKPCLLADAYFANDKLPIAYDLNLSCSLINLTAQVRCVIVVFAKSRIIISGLQAMATTPAAAGVALYGLSSSMFDVAQCGNGGTDYLFYERAVLNSPGVMRTIEATTFHPYAPGVWVPWAQQSWGNTTFYFPNQTNAGLNSTVAMIKVLAQPIIIGSAEAICVRVADHGRRYDERCRRGGHTYAIHSGYAAIGDGLQPLDGAYSFLWQCCCTVKIAGRS